MNLFSFIKSKVSIVDVVNEYTHLKRAGIYWKAHCPFHNEKTASFTVSPHKEIFYCFGCHATGDVISFISRMENCTPVEAVKHLAERYHIDIPSDLVAPEQEGFTQKKDSYFDLCHSVATWANEQLWASTYALEYVRSRGINQQSINNFMLGYFPGGIRSIKGFLNYMSQRNVLAQDLVEAHILAEGSHVMYSPFEERIIFPIKDHLGRFCGFGGRVYKSDDTRPKYYNSREGPYFAKGTLLFGLDLAKKSVQESEMIFMVEGYTDCVAMAQHGYPNTVATLGTACTLEHLKLISRYANTVYVIYDGDTAGQQAMLRLAQLCWQCSLELYTIILPPADDPASLLTRGESLAPYVTKAQDIFSFFVTHLGAQFELKPLQEKMRLSERIIELLSHVDNHLKQDFLIQKAAKVLQVSFDSLKREVVRMCQQDKRTDLGIIPTQERPHTETEVGPSRLEKRIFIAIINNIQLVNGRREKYLIRYFSEPLRSLLMRAKQEKELNPGLEFPQFYDMLNEDEKKFVSQVIMETDDQVSSETLDQLVTQFQKRHWKTMAHDIAVQLEQAKKSQSPEAVQKLIEEFLELKKRVLEEHIL
jgi:DNA primase